MLVKFMKISSYGLFGIFVIFMLIFLVMITISVVNKIKSKIWYNKSIALFADYLYQDQLLDYMLEHFKNDSDSVVAVRKDRAIKRFSYDVAHAKSRQFRTKSEKFEYLSYDVFKAWMIALIFFMLFIAISCIVCLLFDVSAL